MDEPHHEYLDGDLVAKETKGEILDIFRDKSRYWTNLVEYDGVIAAKSIDLDNSNTIFRIQTRIPSPAVEVFEELADFSKHMNWDPFTEGMRVLQEYDEHNQLLYHVQHFNVPCTPRDFVIFRTISVKTEIPHVIAYRSVQFPVMPPRGGILRGECLPSGFVIAPDPSNPNLCTLSFICRPSLRLDNETFWKDKSEVEAFLCTRYLNKVVDFSMYLNRTKMDIKQQDLGRLLSSTLRDICIFFGSKKPKNTFKRYGTEGWMTTYDNKPVVACQGVFRFDVPPGEFYNFWRECSVLYGTMDPLGVQSEEIEKIEPTTGIQYLRWNSVFANYKEADAVLLGNYQEVPGGNSFRHIARTISYPKKPVAEGVERSVILPSGVFLHSTNQGKSSIAFCAFRMEANPQVPKQEELICYRLISIYIHIKNCLDNWRNPSIPAFLSLPEPQEAAESAAKRIKSAETTKLAQIFKLITLFQDQAKKGVFFEHEPTTIDMTSNSPSLILKGEDEMSCCHSCQPLPPVKHLLSPSFGKKQFGFYAVAQCSPACPFGVLPRELSMQILQLLAVRDLLNMSMCSKRCGSLCRASDLWKHRLIVDFPTLELPKQEENMDYRLEYIHHFSLRSNLEKGRPVRTLEIEAHRKVVSYLGFKNDGTLISGSGDKSVKFWNTKPRDFEQQAPKHYLAVADVLGTLNGPSKVNGCYYDAASDKLTIGFSSNNIQCWDLHRETRLLWEKQFIFESSGFRFQPERILSWNETILTLWSNEGDLKNSFRGHTKRILTSEFKGDILASGSVDKTLRTWNVTRPEPLQCYTGHQASVTAIDVIPNENIVISGSTDKTIKTWDLRSSNVVQTWTNCTAAINCVKKNEFQLVSGSEDDCVRMWDLRMSRGYVHKFVCGAPVLSVEGNRNQIAAGLKTGTILVWSFV